MFDNLREDLRFSYGRRVGFWRVPIRFLSYRGFRAVALHRIAHWFWQRGRLGRVAAKIASRLNTALHALVIHPSVEAGPGFTLPHAFSIVIARGTKMGKRAYVFSGVAILPDRNKNAPQIGDDFIAYSGACLCGKITVGNRVTVGVNATLMQSAGDDLVVMPGRPVMLPKRGGGGGNTPTPSGDP